MKVELLAPGGSLEGVKAAINAGADAVYTGGRMFGAREYADNLDKEQMMEAIRYAHIHGRKIYLTVNTLLKDIEIEEQLYEYILPFYENGLDAVIVQDFGVMDFIHVNFPDLPIHASTQMTVMGEETAEFLKSYGVERIVTPRELSICEIKDIYQETNMEIESFVHGALCYCYSGQCFLSSYIGGRSGNRGKCAQPCRLNYDVIKDRRVINKGDNKYVLSPKDICTLHILPDIIEAGVYSLKIEGRMKKTEYTAGITALYRKYIDLYLEKGREGYQVEKSDFQTAMDLFNRNGFHESYYKMHNGKEMISLKKPSFRLENTELIAHIREKYIHQEPKENINIYITILKEQSIRLIATKGDICAEITGSIPQTAIKAPLDRDTVVKQLSKLGNTAFALDVIEVTMDEDIFVTMGELNALRRAMTVELENKILASALAERKNGCKKQGIKQLQRDTRSMYSDEMELTVLVSDKNQAMTVLSMEITKIIYAEADGFNEKDMEEIIYMTKDGKANIYLALPRVFRKKDREVFDRKWAGYLQMFHGFLVRNIEEYFYLQSKKVKENIVFDYNVYVMNRYAKDFFSHLDENVRTTVPVELNYKELKKRGCSGEEIVGYGYMPVMVTANCVAKTCDRCSNSNDFYLLKDRMSQEMDVKCICEYCYNVIYNTKPLSLAKYAKDIKELGVNSVRLEFVKETEEEIRRLITLYDKVLTEKDYSVTDFTDSTRGHFHRGVK